MGLDYVLLYRRNWLCALVMLLLFFDAYFGVLFPGALVAMGRKNILEHSRCFYCIGTFFVCIYG
jgi:hypothetical protein